MMIYLLLSNFIDLVSKISQISLVYSFHQLKTLVAQNFDNLRCKEKRPKIKFKLKKERKLRKIK